MKWGLRVFWLAMAGLTLARLMERHFAGMLFFTPSGAPRLTDFAVFWSAAKQVLSNNAPDIYNAAHQVAYESALLGQQAGPRLVYPYPPTSLLFIWPFGLLGYLQAWIAFLFVGAAAWFFVLRSVTRDSLLAFGMTFAVGGAAYTIEIGQNGFFTAALLCGAMMALPRNKTMAGGLVGLLAFKPQLAMGAFVGLLLWREWRALATAIGVVVVSAALATLIFGWQIWPAFLAGDSSFANGHFSRMGDGPAYMQQTLFAALAFQIGAGAALFVHFLTATLAFLLVAQFEDWDQRRAGLIVSTILLAPFSFLYDITALIGAAALLLRNARSDSEAAAVCFCGALPALWFVTAGQVGYIAALGLLALAVKQSGVLARGNDAP